MTLDRRQLLQRLSLLLGGAISAPVATGLLAGCRTPPAGQPGRVLDASRLRAAGALAERILPRTDTPGALDAGVERFVDEMLAGYLGADERALYLDGLDRLEARAQARQGRSFVACSAEEQESLVAELDELAFGGRASDGEQAEDARFFRLHKELTVAGFYTSEVGQLQELRPMPLGEHLPDVPLGPDQKAWS
ncbi:MAG TPA: gluconate 2-dehydrogenase subunit 3 family protein [Thermoanaerobaculia bacterium]|nr:gluconate 2-dehydrogenase subunit 3 family protein [Thermoanaerobaculia bacterium]